MTTKEDAVRQILLSYSPNAGTFWGSVGTLSLGVGLVYSNVVYPLLDVDTGKFDTVEGWGLVLSHECDVSQENKRNFNEDVLVCPITPFEDVLAAYMEEKQDRVNSFISALAANEISRVMYFPPISQTLLPYGGIVYFNRICSSHIEMFASKSPASALSAKGLESFDAKIKNHLLRPKDERLSFSQTRAFLSGISDVRDV